jgi:hypothetical protein
MPIFPSVRRWRQEDCELNASLNYIARSGLKKGKKGGTVVITSEIHVINYLIPVQIQRLSQGTEEGD